jgi:hypothetical protein
MPRTTVKRKCQHCDKIFFPALTAINRGKGIFCSRSCSISYTNTTKDRSHWHYPNFKGEKNPAWKGGLIQSSKGYWYVFKPNHLRAGKRGYVKRADLILEKKLGRPLKPNEIAHHGPGGKADDSPENLTVMTLSYHTNYHVGLRPKKPSKPRNPLAPSNRRYQWPSNEKLLKMRKSMTLQKIADFIGCSIVSVHQHLKKNR